MNNNNDNNDNNNSNNNADAAPRPPRLMPIQERKKMIQSRRRANLENNQSSTNNHSNNSDGDNESGETESLPSLLSRKRSRTNTANTAGTSTSTCINTGKDHDNDNRGDSHGGARKTVQMPMPALDRTIPIMHSSELKVLQSLPQSHSHFNADNININSSISHHDMDIIHDAGRDDGDGVNSSQSQISASQFATGSGASRSISNLFHNDHSREAAGSNIQTIHSNDNSGQKKKTRNIDALLNQNHDQERKHAQDHEQVQDQDHDDNDNEGNSDHHMFQSPTPNSHTSQWTKPKTPSSLFGEIMKRTQWEINNDADAAGIASGITSAAAVAAADIDIDIDIDNGASTVTRTGTAVHIDIDMEAMYSHAQESSMNGIVQESNLPFDDPVMDPKSVKCIDASTASAAGSLHPIDFEKKPSRGNRMRLQPPTVLRTMPSSTGSGARYYDELHNGIGDSGDSEDNHENEHESNENADKDNSTNDAINISVPVHMSIPLKGGMVTGVHEHSIALAPSLAPRRKNIFKQYSKYSQPLLPPQYVAVSTSTTSTSASTSAATSAHKPHPKNILSSPTKTIFGEHGSPLRRRRISQTQSTPTRYSSPAKHGDYGTPKQRSGIKDKEKEKGHVMWDPMTPTPTSNSLRPSIFHRSSSHPSTSTFTSTSAYAAHAMRSPKTPVHHKTPPRKKIISSSIGVNWDPKTPDTHRTTMAMTPNRYYNSPGGFALQRMLDGCMSPQVQTSFLKEEKKMEHQGGDRLDMVNVNVNEDGDKEGSRSSVGSTSRRDAEDWEECWLRIPSFVVGKGMPTVGQGQFDAIGGEGGVSALVRGEVGVVDWSIKRQVKIECFPDSCIPGEPLAVAKSEEGGMSFSSALDHDKIERLAMNIFLNPDNLVSSLISQSKKAKEREEIVLAQWKAAQMYWQHPAVHPLPPSVTPNVRRQKGSLGVLIGQRPSITRSSSIDQFSGKSSSNLPSVAAGGGGMLQRQASLPSFPMQADSSSSRLSSSTLGISKQGNNNMSLVDTVRGVEAPLRQAVTRSSIGTLGGLGHNLLDEKHVSTVPVMLQQRKDEWQECFRCLFFSWIRRLEELGDVHDESMDAASRCTFYSTLPDQTVLFRPFLDKGNTGSACVPMIVLSSSTISMRRALRSMGIALKMKKASGFIGEQQSFEDLSEDFVEEWLETKESKEDAADSQVHEELEALRRATALESVGAEVSISMLNRVKSTGKGKKSVREFPPLIIDGYDDCMAFYEICLNTMGSLGCVEMDSSANDVPLLICRHLGPGKHMTLCQLSSSTVRAQHEASDDSKDQHQLSSIALHGPVMPCSFRDLLCASATYLSLHKSRVCPPEDTENKENSNGMVDENILGSHYFMMQLVDHGSNESDSKKSVNSKRMGSSGSMWFNGLANTNARGDIADSAMMLSENKQGEVTTMAVWDVNRPLSIAYRSSRPEEIQSTDLMNL